MLQVCNERILDLLQQNIAAFVLLKKKVADVIIGCLVTRVSRARKIHSHPALHHFIVKLEDFEEGSVPYILAEIDLLDSRGSNAVRMRIPSVRIDSSLD